MTNQQILTKTLNKTGTHVLGDLDYVTSRGWTVDELAQWIIDLNYVEQVIFNHEFAKALWGESLIQPKDEDGNYLYTSDGYDEYVYWLPAWQYHLQQMVIADDPIKYLGEHIDD